jgi:predicted transcriptional regulator
MLVKFNFIRKETLDNHDIYFDADMNFEDVKKKYFTSKTKSKKIIDYLKVNNDGITKTQLSNDLKMHPNTITKYLESLHEHDIIIREKISNKTLYFLNSE